MTLLETFFSGFVAAGIAAMLTNPIDVIKTNLMANKDKYFHSYWNCVKFLYQEEGIKVFSRGIIFRTLHVGVMSMIFFGGYEQFLNFCILKHSEVHSK